MAVVVRGSYLANRRNAMSDKTMNIDLPPPFLGEPIDMNGAAGRVTVFMFGDAAPILVAHSVNAAASAAELRPL
jgi:hypothetical protein